MAPKFRRILDPIHGLIEFERDGFETTCWQIIESRQFQRLRRVKQLGFSEFVYPGATHSRFTHSVGVFHTARKLDRVIESIHGDRFDKRRAQMAMAFGERQILQSTNSDFLPSLFRDVKEVALPSRSIPITTSMDIF